MLVLPDFNQIVEKFSDVIFHESALGPGVYSASNRNEYQKPKNNVSGE
jgi:hypothetical protein